MSEVTTNAAEPIVSGTAQAKIEFVSVGRIDLVLPSHPRKKQNWFRNFGRTFHIV